MKEPFHLLPERKKGKETWGNLQGCSLPLALATLCQNTPGVKILITPDHLSASGLLDDLNFFLDQTKKKQQVLIFPDWETLPYDTFSPHQDIISDRLYTLSRLQQAPPDLIVIAAASTLMHRLCPTDFLAQHALLLQEGQTFHLNTFREHLLHAGYRCVNQVLEHGEFAVRGGLIDVYPMGSPLPYRIERFDETIDSLRCFDPESQRTIEKTSSIHVLPARECPMNDKSIAQFRRHFRERFEGNPSQCPLYESISDGHFPNGIEYYLPLFFEKTATFFDYLPIHASISMVGAIQAQAENFWDEACARYEQRSNDITRPLLTPTECFLNPTELLAYANTYEPLRMHHEPTTKKGSVHFNINPGPALPIDRLAEQPLHRLKTYLSEHPTFKSVIVVESAGRREVLLELLKKSGLQTTLQSDWSSFKQATSLLNLMVGPLQEGAEFLDEQLIILVESQLYGEQRTPQRRHQQKTVDPDLIIRDLAELHIGSPVVHLQFGVGRYQGLQTFDHEGIQNEFLILTYAGGDKIYVPVTSLHCITRYTGSEHAPLHRLGSDEWQKEKKKAALKIHDVAIELLEIYAKRAAKPGFIYHYDKEDYQRFASGFSFDETPDQQQAIHQILDDMRSDKPMDRLICGDVGFGKTEVAMRAAFLAVQNGKQVCVLVPTTLLAGQHYETFRDRFAEFPVRIELLSRFVSAKSSEQVIESLTSGQTDIVIGTHKLFQKNIAFKQLGLLIIDEEHRFGVKQKEHINAMRTDIDILSMTATPIPRTLNMAMAGIRDISLIATPPAKRLAIKTFWQEKQDGVLREAIFREISRGGQVFFLHNHVQTIGLVAEKLEALMPEAKVQVAHGQMRERDLERIMSDFYHHRFNVLVCTTIIETGIDIPTANT
ncbi:MAG: transcription-repair coupling factor, partial [Legionellaceae bacterium]